MLAKTNQDSYWNLNRHYEHLFGRVFGLSPKNAWDVMLLYKWTLAYVLHKSAVKLHNIATIYEYDQQVNLLSTPSIFLFTITWNIYYLTSL